MELKAYFPKEFRSNDEVEHNVELLTLIKLEFNKIIDGEENPEITEVEKRMLQMDLPKTWNIHHAGNMEVEMETEFAKFLIAVSEHTNEDTNNITVFRFYALLDHLKDKNKKQ